MTLGRLTAVLVLAAVLAMTVVGSTMAATAAADARPLVTKLRADNLGATVLARGDRQALYYWNREKDGRVRCVGGCAKAWPPYIVPANRAIPRKIQGFAGVFGTVKRPDGRLQLTYNRRPLYAYAHEGKGVVLCDNVDGWFAIRL